MIYRWLRFIWHVALSVVLVTPALLLFYLAAILGGREYRGILRASIRDALLSKEQRAVAELEDHLMDMITRGNQPQ